MPDQSQPASRTTVGYAVRHHLGWVAVLLVLGALAGWQLMTSAPVSYTSTARVLVNPTAGNPFVPTPSSVRQDEMTSLETEAQVLRSAEVLGPVAAAQPGLTTARLQRGLLVSVPANTQVLEISWSTTDRDSAAVVVDAVAASYLANRTRRYDEVTAARVARVEARTATVVGELRAATEAAQQGNEAERRFQTELGEALRNELVSLRAQRTALENSEAPAGSVIAPASRAVSDAGIGALAPPAGGALGGLALGCLVAVLLERLRGTVRRADEVEALGVPVVAAVPEHGWRDRLDRRSGREAIDTTIRRLRAALLDLEPRPDVVAIAPAGSGPSDADVSEAVAESFAKAGHRVVLVRTDPAHERRGLGVDDRGLAQALLHERLNVRDLLQPSVEPLVSLLSDGGFTPQSRELLVADRLRAVLAPLVADGHLVVISSPGIDSAEAEAFLGAADLGVVVVRAGRTRPGAVRHVARLLGAKPLRLAALVVDRHGAARRTRLATAGTGSDSDPTLPVASRHGGAEVRS